MIVSVFVKKGKDAIVEEDGVLIVHTDQPMEMNRANRDIIRQVAEYYHVGQDRVKILRGFKSRKKTLKVL